MQDDAAGTVEAAWRALGDGDWDAAAAMLHDDYVQEWPQSGERIIGRDDAIAVNRNFPGGLPKMRFRRTTAYGSAVVMETELTYADGSVFHGISIFELRDGRIATETDYFAEPFDPPQWRAQWVQRI
jgi:limonene-1,2-epoxide hydrolase